jgi:histidinol-phosphate/aromatic aminotransferase/cobyric acid decarboxylase-like protein
VIQDTHPEVVRLDGASYYLQHPWQPPTFPWTELNTYFDEALTAVSIASFHFGVKTEFVFPYCGLTDLIYYLFEAYSPCTVWIRRGDFPIYKYVLKVLGTRYEEFVFPCDGSLASIRFPKEPGTLCVFSRPHSILGTTTDISDIEAAVASNPEVTFVVDEAYQAFSSAPSVIRLLDKYSNVVCLRSASKEFSLPAIRLGWLFTSNRPLLRTLYSRTYNTVSRLSELLVADVILRQRKRQAENVVYMINERARMEGQVRSLPGLDVASSHTCMIFLRTTASAYASLREKCFAARVQPLFLNDVSVYEDVVRGQRGTEYMVRINIWSKEVNSRVVELLGDMEVS